MSAGLEKQGKAGGESQPLLRRYTSGRGDRLSLSIPEKMLSEKEFENLGLTVKISTDDGSAGFRDRVTDLLRRFLSGIEHLRLRPKADA